MRMSIWSAVLMLFTRRGKHRVLFISGNGKQQLRKEFLVRVTGWHN